MARFTQYIGLSKEALDFLSDAERVTELCGNFGIANEPVMYGVFVKKYDRTDIAYVEVTQCVLWDSGPTIYTCLVCLLTGVRLFEWPEEVFG